MRVLKLADVPTLEYDYLTLVLKVDEIRVQDRVFVYKKHNVWNFLRKLTPQQIEEVVEYKRSIDDTKDTLKMLEE